mmetsp:Transcript_5795/g.8887  ORF Transcript_5795/g.8887 Transcript_5795/m.8887 type:complete len:354 (-) Transcript_5795:3196-4257(-)
MVAETVLGEWGMKLVVEPTPVSSSTHLVVVACLSCLIDDALTQCDLAPAVLVFVLDSPRRGDRTRSALANRHNISWHCVPHVQVGGMTKHSGWFAVRPSLQSTVRTMPRHSIASVINYSNFLPKHHSVPGALSLDLILPFHTPDALVAIPNRFAQHQLCARYLQPEELLSAWDLPNWFPVAPTRQRAIKFVSLLPPLKGLLAMADCCIESLELPCEHITVPALPQIWLPPIDSRGTWLDQLNCWLPPRWTEGILITDEAAKADKAAIPKILWDLRITLPLKAPVFLLERLRAWFYRLYFQCLFRAISLYLRRKYGTTWPIGPLSAVTGGCEWRGGWKDKEISGSAGLAPLLAG